MHHARPLTHVLRGEIEAGRAKVVQVPIRDIHEVMDLSEEALADFPDEDRSEFVPAGTPSDPVEGKCYTDPFGLDNTPEECPNKLCGADGRCMAYPRADGKDFR